ncbi:MAG: hypothetical protein WBP45_01965 [Daejeonella sp.]
MKILKLLTIAMILAITFTACKQDSSSSISIEAKWTGSYVQDGNSYLFSFIIKPDHKIDWYQIEDDGSETLNFSSEYTVVKNVFTVKSTMGEPVTFTAKFSDNNKKLIEGRVIQNGSNDAIATWTATKQ